MILEKLGTDLILLQKWLSLAEARRGGFPLRAIQVIPSASAPLRETFSIQTSGEETGRFHDSAPASQVGFPEGRHLSYSEV